MIRGYSQLRSDQLAMQRKVGDSLSTMISKATNMKELEVQIGGF
jgi:hypothetical protein